MMDSYVSQLQSHVDYGLGIACPNTHAPPLDII